MTTVTSFVSSETLPEHVLSFEYLSIDGIKAKYGLEPQELERRMDDVASSSLLEILFDGPYGPEFDLALNYFVEALTL